MNNLQRISIATLCWALLFAPQARGGDWPQILGPFRSGKATDERLADRWPANGPLLLWKKQGLGRGFAGVAVQGEIVLLFHRLEDRAVCEALSRTTGQPIWQARFDTGYQPNYVSDDGPRCVPIVAGDRVILYGADGDLHCLSLADGAIRWTRALYNELGAPRDNFFGAGSSPLVEGDLVLVNAGSRAGAGLVACRLSDGTTKWQATNESASYSSPVAATVDGARHAIFVTRLNVVSIDPVDGKERFRTRFGSLGPTVNAANPLVLGNRLFVTASYGVGARLFEISAAGLQEVWQGESISSQYTTPIEQEGYLYGIDGRQDQGVARLRCIDLADGSVQWSQDDFGMATLILADGKLLIQKTTGALVLVEPSPKSLRLLSTSPILDAPVQALGALAGGLYFARDGRTLKCYDLRPTPP